MGRGDLHRGGEGPPPPVDLKQERTNGFAVRQWIEQGKTTAVHDLSDGGLLVALAEMAMASGIGATLDLTLDAAQAFGEDQGRYVITTRPGVTLEGAVKIGTVGGDSLVGVPVATLKDENERFFREWMEGALDVSDISGN